MIEKPALHCKYSAGQVGSPTYHNGPTTIISTKSADMKGRVVTTTASGENRSKKWKGGAQDVPSAGRNQYE